MRSRVVGLKPVTWDGNDITLWPGESQTLTVSYDSAVCRGHGEAGGATPVIRLSGWNVPARDISAPPP